MLFLKHDYFPYLATEGRVDSPPLEPQIGRDSLYHDRIKGSPTVPERFQAREEPEWTTSPALGGYQLQGMILNPFLESPTVSIKGPYPITFVAGGIDIKYPVTGRLHFMVLMCLLQQDII